MHRTLGDGYVQGEGKYRNNINIYADENPPERDATQVRHEEMNAIQEEICNVIEGEGLPLNDASEAEKEMFQLETAINRKLKTSRIENQSNVNGTTATNALNTLDQAVGSLDSSVSSAHQQIDDLQEDIGTVVGDDLQTQIAAERIRNDEQDAELAAFNAQLENIDPSNAQDGDSFIFTTDDSKWHPASQVSVLPYVVKKARKGLRYSDQGLSHDTQVFDGIVASLYGRYADPNDTQVPGGDSSFARYDLPSSDIVEWHLDAMYYGENMLIRGGIVFETPETIIGYQGYVTNVFTNLRIWPLINGEAPGLGTFTLWGGAINFNNWDRMGRVLAPFKRVASGENYRYASQGTGSLICFPLYNTSIVFGSEDTWDQMQTRPNARTMPSVFEPSKRYAISFEVSAGSADVNPL